MLGQGKGSDMKIDRSTLSTRSTKRDIQELKESVQTRLKRSTEKDVYALEEVEEKLNDLIKMLDGLEGRLL